MSFDLNRDEGKVALTFIIVTFVLLVFLLPTCIVCWCWRYKLHKRKQEIKAKDAEIGFATPKKPGCRCCGCWLYCCRSCRGCCEPTRRVEMVTLPPASFPTPPIATQGVYGCQGGSSGNQFGWSKDMVVYNTGTPVITPTHGCSSQPVNFSNRWSSCNDGRLVLNGAGAISKFTPGAQTYGGIYPSMPSGISAGDQFLLNGRKLT